MDTPDRGWNTFLLNKCDDWSIWVSLLTDYKAREVTLPPGQPSGGSRFVLKAEIIFCMLYLMFNTFIRTNIVLLD